MELITYNEAVSDIAALYNREPMQDLFILCVFPEGSINALTNVFWEILEKISGPELKRYTLSTRQGKAEIKGRNTKICLMMPQSGLYDDNIRLNPTHIFIYMGEYYKGSLDRIRRLYATPSFNVNVFY